MAGAAHPGLVGIFGRPYLDLETIVFERAWGNASGPASAAIFPELHEEICLALAQMPLDYTGGSHRSMDIMPEARRSEALVDYQEVIRGMTDAEFETFRSLSDDPRAIDASRRRELEFGEERAISLSRRQMQWLKIRFGVFFPWKGYVELIPNRKWEDKSNAEGKSFTRAAEAFFPKTIAFVRSLPFASIGRCNIMGLEGFDYGTVHRDGDPADQSAPDQFITVVPAANKRLYLWDDRCTREVDVDSRVYWFNDFDYHGVRADPFFRYSLRVDGVFLPAFYRSLEERFHAR
ncbi:MAG: hypothetical protein HOW73_32320 [Polyangiaceae bacterium]|nr:hypothetical protein [Polyangiaceae bacterium]